MNHCTFQRFFVSVMERLGGHFFRGQTEVPRGSFANFSQNLSTYIHWNNNIHEKIT